MIPFSVMLGAILVARGIGAMGVGALLDWPSATRVGLAVMFIFTGIARAR